MGQAGNILRWPLWSWRNLSTTAAVVLLVLYGLGRVVEPPFAKPHVPAATVTSSSTESPAVGSPPVATAAPDETPATSRVPDADTSEGLTRFATAFAKAWSSSASSQEEWTRGIRPYVTSALGDGLAHTDPAQVPATKVTGDGTLLTSSATSAQVRVPTDGGNILVTVHQGSSGWRISEVAPAGQPPGAPEPDLKQRTSPARS